MRVKLLQWRNAVTEQPRSHKGLRWRDKNHFVNPLILRKPRDKTWISDAKRPCNLRRVRYCILAPSLKCENPFIVEGTCSCDRHAHIVLNSARYPKYNILDWSEIDLLSFTLKLSDGIWGSTRCTYITIFSVESAMTIQLSIYGKILRPTFLSGDCPAPHTDTQSKKEGTVKSLHMHW